MNNKCVYLHKNNDGTIKYVGSGSISRANSTHANTHRGFKYTEYVNEYGKLNVEIIKTNLSTADAITIEIQLYEIYKDSLLNISRPKMEKVISKDIFSGIVYYDETSKTGLRWNIDGGGPRGHSRRIDSEAGYLDIQSGYYITQIDGVNYRNHRIIAVLHDIDINGLVIDHIDGNRSNNNILNLRAVTHGVNSENRKMSKRNTSGVIGVSFETKSGSWVASWTEQGKRKLKNFNPKNYDTQEDAFKAACEYRSKMVQLLKPS